MGGAFTAIADDGSGGYYNPGGLAFSRRSSVALSASVYGIETGSYTSALGTGHDYSYKDLNFVPVATTLMLKFGQINPDTGSPDNTVALSVFVPDAVHNDDRDIIGSSQNAFSLTDNAETLWIGAGYARRFGAFGLGVMGYGLIGSSTGQLDLNVVNPQNRAEFGVITARTDVSMLAAVGAIGIRLDATDEIQLGLSAFSPAIGTGSRRVFVRVGQGQVGTTPPALVVVNQDNLDAAPTVPLRVQFGVAWHRTPWTLAADLMLLGPKDVLDNPELASAGLSRHVVRQTVLNGSFGGEYVINNVIPLRAGIFTDFAASPSPRGTAAGGDVSNPTHVNRYGLSISGGYAGEHVRTDIGFNVAYGQGRDLIPQNLDFTNLVPTDVKQLSAYFFLATSYEF
jgi:hypothetical protein